jgi:hypothetical protein
MYIRTECGMILTKVKKLRTQSILYSNNIVCDKENVLYKNGDYFKQYKCKSQGDNLIDVLEVGDWIHIIDYEDDVPHQRKVKCDYGFIRIKYSWQLEDFVKGSYYPSGVENVMLKDGWIDNDKPIFKGLTDDDYSPFAYTFIVSIITHEQYMKLSQEVK